MTNHDKTPDEPGPAARPTVPCPRPAAEDMDMREMQDPYDLPFPTARPLATRPSREYAIVVDQLRGWRPGQPPSLAELLETGRHTREPEPDLEAEP